MEFEVRDGWPPLAWVARCAESVELVGGCDVEAGPGWAFEGAWAGTFADAGFSDASVVCGSGMVVEGPKAIFVSPSSTIDRLCSLEVPGGVLVSNSLLALLAETGSVVTDSKYPAKVKSIVRGIRRCASAIETSAGSVTLTYFDNLAWSEGKLERRPKPRPAASFVDFGSYRNFLADSYRSLSLNGADPARRRQLHLLGTVSSGYDANAATALAVGAGCEAAIAFETTGRGQPDSGVPVAEALGIEPIVIDREAWRSEPQLPVGTEVPFLAAGAGSGLIGFHGAREHLRGALLVSGFYGDSIWNPEWPEVGTDIVRKDASGLGFCEYRLHAGFANCAPAFWAAPEVAEVVAISQSDELEPWSLGEGYDRPLPRRIAEEAGAPRDAFGHHKRAVPKAQPHRDSRFLTPAAKRDYFAWLRAHRNEPGIPRVVSPALDRATHGWRDLIFRAHIASGNLRPLARTAIWKRRRRELRRNRRRPTPQRAHAVAWALDRGRDAFGG